jgi:hypothetical protein
MLPAFFAIFVYKAFEKLLVLRIQQRPRDDGLVGSLCPIDAGELRAAAWIF